MIERCWGIITWMQALPGRLWLTLILYVAAIIIMMCCDCQADRYIPKSQVPSQHLGTLEILDQAPGKVEIHSNVNTVVVGHGHPVGLHLQLPLPLDVSRPGSRTAMHVPQAETSTRGSDQEEAHSPSQSQIRQSNGSFRRRRTHTHN